MDLKNGSSRFPFLACNMPVLQCIVANSTPRNAPPLDKAAPKGVNVVE
jgi:hypothetical protein